MHQSEIKSATSSSKLLVSEHWHCLLGVLVDVRACEEAEITHRPNDRHNVINFVSGDWARSGEVGGSTGDERGVGVSRGPASPVRGMSVLRRGRLRHRLLHADLSSLAAKYRSGVLMQRDLRPERAAIERRSSPAAVVARMGSGRRRLGRRRGRIDPVPRRRQRLYPKWIWSGLERRKDVDDTDVVITENYRCLSV